MVKYKDFMLGAALIPTRCTGYRTAGPYAALRAVIPAGTDHRRLSPSGRDYSGNRHAYFSGIIAFLLLCRSFGKMIGGDSGLCQLQLYRHCRQFPISTAPPVPVLSRFRHSILCWH